MPKTNTNTNNPKKQAGGVLRPFLELVRPPALLTASADSLAGWAWATSTVYFIQQHPKQFNDSPLIDPMIYDTTNYGIISVLFTAVILMLCSTMIYAAGMATNDIFDYQEDLQDRPFRPLPSQRIRLKTAWCFALGLQITALIVLAGGLAWLWGLHSKWPLYLAFFTILMTYLYNKVFKQSMIAPLFMGLCRFGNFWIGASLVCSIHSVELVNASVLNLNQALYPSLGTLGYVTALTALSRYEVKGGNAARLWAGLLVVLSTHPIWWQLLDISWVTFSLVQEILLYPITLACTFWIYSKLSPLLKGDHSASQVQKAVGTGIRGVALTNICLCIAFGLWPFALLLFVLALTAGKVARWFYAT